MNAGLLRLLKQGTELAKARRFDRLRRMPFRTLAPYVLARSGHLHRTRATTFFGREMSVVLPEPVSVSIWRYGFFEHDVAFYLLLMLRPGDALIDIGGHFGFFSMLGRELVGAAGTVVTFEPMPNTRDILTENMELHAGPALFHLIPAAAGSASGMLKFKSFGLFGSAFATSFTPRSDAVRFEGEVEVEVRTIDRVVDELGLSSCKVMKIDAENAEYDVVQGALSMIRRLRPAIILEAGDIGVLEKSTRRVVDVLVAERYQPFELDDWSVRPHAVTANYGYQNLLLVPSERLSELLPGN
jgi:FkbM family methyltransferase